MFIGLVWRHKHWLDYGVSIICVCVCVCVCIHKYLYVDPNTIAQKVSMHHVGMLLDKYTKLLLDIVLHGYLGALPHDITLLGAQDLDDVGPMDMVIVRWLY